jgi:hypothetical protein
MILPSTDSYRLVTKALGLAKVDPFTVVELGIALDEALA